MAETERSGPARGRSTTLLPSRITHRGDSSGDYAAGYERGFCDGWLDRATYARRTSLTFDDGVEWGWHMAHRAMRNAIAEATDGMPHDAAEVVAQLVRVLRAEVAA